jgi:protein-L-isoaspartate(D-aspartate) O-methyltransferase
MRFLLEHSASLALLLLLVPLGSAGAQDELDQKRRQMVESQIRSREIRDERVLQAMAKVPRHLFVPDNVRAMAYEDFPLPIGADQTISQPYIVALMTSLLELDGSERVLEIGTGSGYQAAVLGEVAGEVYSVEIVESLGQRAKETLGALGYRNVQVRIGDGFAGWPEHAPFDGILVTAAPPKVPQPLLDQLKPGGKLVIPVGRFFQDLMVYKKTEKGFEKRNVIPVRFVPMTGEAEKSDASPPR